MIVMDKGGENWDIQKKAGPNYSVEFTASFWWFKWFKDRHSLRNVKVSGESVCADMKAAEEFLETLDKLIWRKKILARANI